MIGIDIDGDPDAAEGAARGYVMLESPQFQLDSVDDPWVPFHLNE